MFQLLDKFSGLLGQAFMDCLQHVSLDEFRNWKNKLKEDFHGSKYVLCVEHFFLIKTMK
jgi:hypothetical protein